ncbi:hypothetical protein JVT61DRAFT_12595 [Boletus reticuloceps]|uniref:Uncharacterized protein n=1 Tax=Boletus reticuloceps TaxID=495285 RepID=A0A8I2YDL1_9AGAM|nr:hypothetical protein JVT61DRAFT_12595 [Boletus reticuloceps]
MKATKRLHRSRSTAENESDVDSDLQNPTPSEATSSGKGSAEQEQPNDRCLLADQSGLEGDDKSVRTHGQGVLRQSKDHDHQIHKDGLTQNHGPTKKGKQRQCTPAPCQPTEQEGSNDEALPADQSGLQADRSNGKQSEGKQKEKQKEMVRQSEDDAWGVDGPAEIHRPISKGKQRQCTPAPRQILRTATEGAEPSDGPKSKGMQGQSEQVPKRVVKGGTQEPSNSIPSSSMELDEVPVIYKKPMDNPTVHRPPVYRDGPAGQANPTRSILKSAMKRLADVPVLAQTEPTRLIHHLAAKKSAKVPLPAQLQGSQPTERPLPPKLAMPNDIITQKSECQESGSTNAAEQTHVDRPTDPSGKIDQCLPPAQGLDRDEVGHSQADTHRAAKVADHTGPDHRVAASHGQRSSQQIRDTDRVSNKVQDEMNVKRTRRTDEDRPAEMDIPENGTMPDANTPRRSEHIRRVPVPVDVDYKIPVKQMSKKHREADDSHTPSKRKRN